MEITETHVFEDVEQVYAPAPAGKRFVNYIVDTIMYYIFYLGSAFMIGVFIQLTSGGAEDFADFLDSTVGGKLVTFLAAFTMMVLFYTVVEGVTKGRSLGKLITGTVAVREDGGNLTWKDALMRSLCRIIPFEAFSGFGGRPWHDTMTKTVVISK